MFSKSLTQAAKEENITKKQVEWYLEHFIYLFYLQEIS